MPPKPMFDTLNYAKLLSDGGVHRSDVHASSLATVLHRNLYTTDEIDMRFEQTIGRFEQTISRFENRVDKALNDFRISQEKMRAEWERESRERDKKFYEMEVRFERALNRYFITTISVLGSLIVLAGTVSTFAHAIFH